MGARQDLDAATRRLEELAQRIADAADRPVAEIEELARQASDLSAAVVDIIPRAIAEAEEEARGDVPRIGDPAPAEQAPAPGGATAVPDGLAEDQPA